jgi:hypothetical protein
MAMASLHLKPRYIHLRKWRLSVLGGLSAFFLLGTVFSSFGTEARHSLHGHVPGVVFRLQAEGLLPATNRLDLAIGLPLRNEAALDELIRQLYDPGSTNFHKFLTPAEFTARFGPTEADYESLVQFAQTNGFKVVSRHGNRLVLDVEASATNVQRAFQIKLHTYRHPTEPRDFFAPDSEPSVPTNLVVADIWGLSDYGRAHPLLRTANPLQARALNGSGPSGYYAGNDFRNAYAPGCPLTGAGQVVGLLEFSGYYQADITNYERTIGLSRFVPLNNIIVGGNNPSTQNNAEVALDIEVAIAMAPGLSQVVVYEEKYINPSSILSRMANDNIAKQMSSSWTWSGGPSTTVDSAFKQMAAQGQTFFQASGDDDAYTGSQILGNSGQTDSPVDSTNITVVGGTTLTMNGSGNSWSSEKVWNYASYGGNMANEGSGGGISSYYKIPVWQVGINTNANLGSTVWRNVPDVALTADNIYVAYNNGSSGGFAGTSCAAPLWAGFCALANQESVATSGTTVGFLNPAIYTIGNSASYTSYFHDITSGNNIGTNTPGLFCAAPGYDLCTGWGTPNGTNLINALASVLPYFLIQPGNQTVVAGSNATFSGSVVGPTPFTYRWLFNGTNLPPGGNASGIFSSTLSITGATAANAGNYSLLVGNSFGSVTSSVAALTVLVAPGFSSQPTNVTILAGGNATFGAAVSGSNPLAYQWQENGTNLADGSGVSGANTATLTLTGVTTNCGTNFTLVAANSLGAATSAVAVLTVVVPPAIIGPLTNQAIECGGNATFTVAASGTPPLSYQWTLDGSPIPGATSNSVLLTGIHLPSHTVGVIVTNLYAGATNNAALTVLDTTPPVITLNGGNPITIELGAAFTDPGATASDACAGLVSVSTSGTVNTNAVGTNIIAYTADDGNGNTNTAARTVIVRDTTPPAISWSFTNLTLAALTNCSAPMPDVTGTNYILATDLSGALTISQNPTNNFALPVGTNQVLISVADASGNTSISTNTIVVQDQTPPLIFSEPQSQNSLAGSTASFSVAATACTSPAYQWFFNEVGLAGQTNSSLTLASVSLTNAGNYFVIATTPGGSVTSSVAVLTVFTAPVISGVAANPDGTFTLNLAGTVGDTYILETTTNLFSAAGWQPIATNTLQTNALWQFNDTNATNFSQRFYRLMLAPDPVSTPSVIQPVRLPAPAKSGNKDL